jgi:hypothetical protein
MKRIFLVLFVGLLVSSLCFAQETPKQDNQNTPKLATTVIITGKVESISLGDSQKSQNPEIVVVDDKGEKVNFEIKAGTGIYTKVSNANYGIEATLIPLAKVMVGDKVTVEYLTTQTGIRRVVSMTVIK